MLARKIRRVRATRTTQTARARRSQRPRNLVPVSILVSGDTFVCVVVRGIFITPRTSQASLQATAQACRAKNATNIRRSLAAFFSLCYHNSSRERDELRDLSHDR